MNLVYHFLHARNTQLLEPGSVLFKEHDALGPMYVLLEGAARILSAAPSSICWCARSRSSRGT
jgi:hypothetical protein